MPDFYRSSTLIVPDGVVLSTPLNHQKPPTQHCHSQWCSWHVGYADQMLTLSSSATMSSWHSVQDGSSHPHTCVLKCYCALHVHECYWINQMNSYFNQQHPLETNQFLDGLNQTLPYIFHILNLDSHAIHDIILPLHMRYPCQSHFNLYTTNTRISIIVTHASIQCSATPWFRSSSTCASLGQELPGCSTLVRLHSRWPWSSTGSVFSWTPHPQLLFHFA